jgi:hypothetical protein
VPGVESGRRLQVPQGEIPIAPRVARGDAPRRWPRAPARSRCARPPTRGPRGPPPRNTRTPAREADRRRRRPAARTAPRQSASGLDVLEAGPVRRLVHHDQRPPDCAGQARVVVRRIEPEGVGEAGDGRRHKVAHVLGGASLHLRPVVVVLRPPRVEGGETGILRDGLRRPRVRRDRLGARGFTVPCPRRCRRAAGRAAPGGRSPSSAAADGARRPGPPAPANRASRSVR